MASSSEAALKLRQELKDWERAFAEAHDGRKPTREEVKLDVKIAAKYKEYAKLRAPSATTDRPSPSSAKSRPSSSGAKSRPSSSSARPSSSSARTPKPDDSADNPFGLSAPPSRPVSTRSTRSTNPVDVFRTPTKPTDGFRTPTRPHADTFDSPLSTRGRRLFGNRPRDTVGPTPQKQGKVLGLFDSFSSPSPTKPTRPPPPTNNPSTTTVAATTTTTTTTTIIATTTSTPTSPLTTPRKRKAPTDLLSTPAFLRRTKYFTVVSSPPVPQPLKPPVRGLSSMVAELRKLEDDAHAEAHADEEEAMRELEGGGGGMTPPPQKSRIIENDPNTGLPPPPEGAWVDDEREEEEEGGGDEGPQRKWKKKGLKRQHRRVIMRPVGRVSHTGDSPPPKPPKPEEVELPSAGYDDDDDDDGDGDDLEVEAQAEAEAAGVREAAVAKRAKMLKEKEKEKEKELGGKKEGTGRKISERAHTNYKRLNIRGSKGAKAGVGGGRFSRKRR